MFVFLSLHPVVCFSLWSTESHQCLNWWAYQYILDCSVFTLWHSMCCCGCHRTLVNQFFPRHMWLLRKTVTETDCVSPDTFPMRRTIRAQSHSLHYCEHKGCQRKWEIKQRVPGMIKPSAKTWCHSDRSLIWKKGILLSVPDTGLNGR